MLEIRILHQQDMITQLKKDHETILSGHILLPKANIVNDKIDPVEAIDGSDNTHTLPQYTNVTESDVIKRRKTVF